MRGNLITHRILAFSLLPLPELRGTGAALRPGAVGKMRRHSWRRSGDARSETTQGMKRDGLQAWRMEGWRSVWGEGGLQTGRHEEAENHGDQCQHGWDMRSGKDEGVRGES